MLASTAEGGTAVSTGEESPLKAPEGKLAGNVVFSISEVAEASHLVHCAVSHTLPPISENGDWKFSLARNSNTESWTDLHCPARSQRSTWSSRSGAQPLTGLIASVHTAQSWGIAGFRTLSCLSGSILAPLVSKHYFRVLKLEVMDSERQDPSCRTKINRVFSRMYWVVMHDLY